MAATKQRDFLQSLWNLFCSLKLSMFLFISLAAISIIGTIVPQGQPSGYLKIASNNKLMMYQMLGFFDLYHSWWFILLLYLLSVNLTACSVKRLPHIWKIVSKPTLVMDGALEQSLTNKFSIITSYKSGVLKEQIHIFLQKEFARPIVFEIDGTWHFFAQKTPWCRLSVYFVHLSVIIIFVGALIGSFFGFKGFVNLPEGESITKVATRNGKVIDFGFSLRCEQFSIALYKNGAPKEFKSILTVVENGKPIRGFTNVRVVVNEPLTYKGITFYQSSYGNAGNYFFTVNAHGGIETFSLTLKSNETGVLPDGSTLHVVEATDDISQFVPKLSGPAVRVEVHTPEGTAESFIVYANYPDLNLNYALEHKLTNILQYKGCEKKIFTGLQVAKDPGVWIVWIGCVLMVLGIYGAFFMSHRRIWIRMQDGFVSIGGNSSKNQGAFDLYFRSLGTKLKKNISEREQY